MAKCDLCGSNCGALRMAQLLESYQVPGIVDICPDCTKWAEKTKGDIIGEIPERMRAAIVSKSGKKRRAGWQLWFGRFVNFFGA